MAISRQDARIGWREIDALTNSGEAWNARIIEYTIGEINRAEEHVLNGVTEVERSIAKIRAAIGQGLGMNELGEIQSDARYIDLWISRRDLAWRSLAMLIGEDEANRLAQRNAPEQPCGSRHADGIACEACRAAILRVAAETEATGSAWCGDTTPHPQHERAGRANREPCLGTTGYGKAATVADAARYAGWRDEATGLISGPIPD